MLDVAIKYKEQLNKLQYDLWFNDKYKYWNNSIYYQEFQINSDTWNKHQFVSVKDGKVIGYIAYNIARETNSVYALSVINFSDNKIIFGKDLRQALNDIFDKYRFNKIDFTVVIGNPIEETYDKMVKKYGGNIIGIKRDEAKLIDGKFYDLKLYEILADEYQVFKNINKYKNK
jgi:hypothetical protein